MLYSCVSTTYATITISVILIIFHIPDTHVPRISTAGVAAGSGSSNSTCVPLHLNMLTLAFENYSSNGDSLSGTGFWLPTHQLYTLGIGLLSLMRSGQDLKEEAIRCLTAMVVATGGGQRALPHRVYLLYNDDVTNPVTMTSLTPLLWRH